MWSFFLFSVLASATALKCFYSDKAIAKNVNRHKSICAVELNLYNLGCLSPPVLSLYDVETSYATTGSSSKLGNNGQQAVCHREEHYVKCYCTWDVCNQNWTKLNEMGDLTLSDNPQLSKCIVDKCSQGHICSSYGSEGAKKFNHYPIPKEHTFNPREKKNTKMNKIEIIILWATGGGILLAVVSLVIYAYIVEMLNPPMTAQERKDAAMAEAVNAALEKPANEPKQDETKQSEKKAQ